MADIGRSSFIPKEVAGLTPGKIRRKRTFHIFGFISTIMLVGSLALGVGVYFLESTAKKDLAAAQAHLAEQKDMFKPEYISEVREFDRRLQAGEVLLQNHIAPLKIFAALEDATKQSIQFTSFSLEHNPGREMIVSLQGVTPSFKSLALQKLEFGNNQILKDIVVSDLGVDEGKDEDTNLTKRNVVFSLKGLVDMGLIHYDGAPVYTETPTAFIETDGGLAISDNAPEVLGESITEEDI